MDFSKTKRKKIFQIMRTDILRVAREIFIPEKLNFVLVGPYSSELKNTLERLVRDF